MQCRGSDASQVAWNPHNDHQFVAALENGTLQIWDTRNKAAVYHKIAAHDAGARTWRAELTLAGTCLCGGMAPRPADRQSTHRLGRPRQVHPRLVPAATTCQAVTAAQGRDAGRRPPRGHAPQHPDALIGPSAAQSSVPPISTAGRARGLAPELSHAAGQVCLHRHATSTQAGSCSLVSDVAVHVWDTRRPYVPAASFTQQRDVVTGIAWGPDGCNVLAACSKVCVYTLPTAQPTSRKDATVSRLSFLDAERPELEVESRAAGLACVPCHFAAESIATGGACAATCAASARPRRPAHLPSLHR